MDLPGGPDVIPESSLLSNKSDLALTTPDTTAKAVVDHGADFKIIGTQYQKNPIGVVSLASNPVNEPKDLVGNTAASAQARLLGALAETLPITLAGMAAGLMVAFGLAILGEIRPAIARSLMPVALVSQTMPLVALTPLLVLLLGRGAAVTLAITVSVTFFPAYETMAQGLQLVPRAAFDLTRAYGASWLQELYMVAIPSALPYVFAATRLAVPRALLGVMIAEWLATGVGLGNLLNQSRGYLDYGMIWAVAVVSVILSILFYQAVTMVERRVLARAGMWGR